MRTLSCNKQDTTVILSHEEVEIINNALNEVCHALDIPEFSTRLGADMSEVQHLLQEIHVLSVAMEEKAGTQSAASTK
jgi:hypothetical protein